MAEIQMHPRANVISTGSTDGKNEIESTQELSQKWQHKSFKERLDEIPAYTMTLIQLCNIYLSIKERNGTLKKAFDTGEYCVKTLAETAKPFVMAATTSALATAKPFIGDIKDPVGKLDSVASETLAKVEEKFPVIRKTPSEIVESTKEVIKNIPASCFEKFQSITAVKLAHEQVNNAITLSELMLELCFPTDGSCKEDVEELDRAEEDESNGALVRVTHLKDRLKRRGRKKLMTIKPVHVTVDAVHYAQQRILEMNKKLNQGSNYAERAQTFVHQTSDTLKEKASGVWEKVYFSTMYIPSKTIQVSGELYISAKEMRFAYTMVHYAQQRISEMNKKLHQGSNYAERAQTFVHQTSDILKERASGVWDNVYFTTMYVSGELYISAKEMHFACTMAHSVEKYYAALKSNVPMNVLDVADKAVAFVMVPTEIVSEYILSSRPIQWVIPNIVKADEIKIVEDIEMEVTEREIYEAQTPESNRKLMLQIDSEDEVLSEATLDVNVDEAIPDDAEIQQVEPVKDDNDSVKLTAIDKDLENITETINNNSRHQFDEKASSNLENVSAIREIDGEDSFAEVGRVADESFLVIDDITLKTEETVNEEEVKKAGQVSLNSGVEENAAKNKVDVKHFGRRESEAENTVPAEQRQNTVEDTFEMDESSGFDNEEFADFNDESSEQYEASEKYSSEEASEEDSSEEDSEKDYPLEISEEGNEEIKAITNLLIEDFAHKLQSS